MPGSRDRKEWNKQRQKSDCHLRGWIADFNFEDVYSAARRVPGGAARYAANLKAKAGQK